MKLLLDEMYSDAISVALRTHGFEALSVREVTPSLSGALDEEVLRAAAALERTFVTENVRDFRPLELTLLADGGHHRGIVYTTCLASSSGSSSSTVSPRRRRLL